MQCNAMYCKGLSYELLLSENHWNPIGRIAGNVWIHFWGITTIGMDCPTAAIHKIQVTQL